MGSHRIQVRIDDMASREKELTVKEGETVDLGCRARPGAAFFNPLLIGKPIRLSPRRAGWTDPPPRRLAASLSSSQGHV